MVSHNESEGVESRNMSCCIGPRVSPPGSQQRCTRFGKCISGVPGSQTIAGHSTVHSGTRESHIVPNSEASNPDMSGKRRRRKYGDMAVGPGHIRVTDGVMPIQSREPGTLEEPGSKM